MIYNGKLMNRTSIFQIIFGKLSDTSLLALNRVTYLFLASILPTLVTFFAIFFGGHYIMFTLTYMFGHANIGIYECLTPILIHEHFGRQRFASLWGFIVTANGVCLLGLRLLLNFLTSDAQYYESDSYQTWYILCFSCCLVSTISLLAIVPSQKESLKQWNRRVR